MTTEKPTLHLEGLVLEAEVKQGGTPPKEFRKIRIGILWLSCWTPGLYPLMVEGKYLAVDYTATKRETPKGTFTNYNIQEAVEIAAPKPSLTPEPERRGSGQDAERVSIEAQTAAKCTAQVITALVEKGEIELAPSYVFDMIAAFYQGMQRAKHMGAAAQPMEAIPDSPTGPVSKTPTRTPPQESNSDAAPSPIASSAAAPKPEIPYMSREEFDKAWAEVGLPTKAGPAMTKLIQSLTDGKVDTIGKALSLGMQRRELLEAATKKVQV